MTSRVSVAVLTLAFTGLASCATAPEVQPAAAPALVSQELAVPEQDLTDFTIRFEGQVAGPQAGTLVKASYELVVDGKTVKTGEQPFGTALAAGAPTAFSLQQHSQYVQDAAALKALGSRGGDLLAAIRGTLLVDANGKRTELLFAKSREIRLPRLPRVVMNEVDFARFAPDEAGGTLYVGVKNPNPFPIRLSGLSYAATINGKAIGDGELGKGEEVAAASTGVFEVQLNVNAETYGAEVDKLIKTLTLPYVLTGELTGKLFQEPYELKGEIKLNVSK
jgi:hypothetical protein